jgi:hypothetical protein
MEGKTMTITVTYAIDSLDPNPAVELFDTMSEAQDWIADEMQRRIDWTVSHSPYPIREDELEEMREIELTLVHIED